MKYLLILFACTHLLFAQEIKTKTYKVQPKETLYSISKKFNITVDEIKKVNPSVDIASLSIGQEIAIPLSQDELKKINAKNIPNHTVQAQETLFGIAKMYNVSVQDLENLNQENLKEGLKTGQVLVIPTRKKTVDGKSRIINEETIFHKVKAGETKYSVSKLYNISIKQLEIQNPEIINRFAVGTVLAVNKEGISPQDISDELMNAIAEKDAVIEKNKAQNAKIEDLEDRLIVQQQMNQKIIKMNSVDVDLKEIDNSKGSSVDKLKLILASNKNIQDVLTSKLDSLVGNMYEDLEKLKNSHLDVEEYRKLQKETQANRIETSKLIIQLKKDLNESRKNYVALMNKVQRVNVAQDQELKKRNKSMTAIEAQNKAEQEQIAKIKALHEDSDRTNESLFFKMATIEKEKEYIITKRIEKATFYSASAREYDDRLALQKLVRYQNNIKKEKNIIQEDEKPVSLEEIRAKIKASNFSNEKQPAIERITNLKQVEDGFYIVLKVTKDQNERDEFARVLSDQGELKTSFFYDINTFTYCVYTNKFKLFEEALFAIKTKESLPLYENAKIVEVKLE
ncbi:conserved hypothetical protein [Flavobacterium sp. 9AF]|uniref:LysM peptidoglycan-binding domain-containing protein n=1 Tax=Flavobacterium sp. 9AF TaxID=2653142 RepID=UPI0012F414A7|nr:LysM domain-containing protein [Flavobacterium sp. 9AF]VXC30362.1 conserved hypothetical protein [Flavobacterium sp. 9AF]